MESPWTKMVVASFLVALVAVAVFTALYRAKVATERRDRMVARLIEMFLYQESLRASSRAAGRLMGALGRYLGSILLPLVAAIIPVVTILIMVEAGLAFSPIPLGEGFLVETRGEREKADSIGWIESEGVELTAPPFRIPSEGRTVWRFKAIDEGKVPLAFGSEEDPSTVQAVVGREVLLVRPQWSRSVPLRWLPGVGSIESGPLSAVSIEYPVQRYRLLGFSCGWLTAISILSFIIAIPLAIAFRIQL